MVDWLQPTPRDTPIEEMRARYERDGYVWLKNVIPRSDVYDCREAYFKRIAAGKMLAPGTTPREGIFDQSLDPMHYQGLGAAPETTSQEALDRVHASKGYNDFLAHPALRDAVREFTGWKKERLMKRGLIRHNVPKSKCPSGIHYDQLFLRAGDPVFVTAWVPIGDCPADAGGLMYLEKSCELGEQIEERFKERQEKEKMPREERVSAFNRHMGELGHLSHNATEWAGSDGNGKRWLVADYEAGDVVFHHPWMIHSASRNTNREGKIRLATDLRFYEEGANADERWNQNSFYHGDGL